MRGHQLKKIKFYLQEMRFLGKSKIMQIRWDRDVDLLCICSMNYFKNMYDLEYLLQINKIGQNKDLNDKKLILLMFLIIFKILFIRLIILFIWIYEKNL